MKKRKVLLLALLLSAVFAQAGTTTLTGTLKDSFGTGINGQLLMYLPVPAQDPSTGTAIAPIPVSFRLVNGAISGGASLFDVNTINPSGLYYIARAYDTTGTLVFYGNYIVTGASFNLGAAIPTTVTTSNISYQGVGFLGLTNTWTGANFFKSINGIQFCDQFSGATADVKLNACIAALPVQGGIADARGLTGAQTIAGTVTIPSKVTLLAAGQSVWTCTINNAAQSCFLMNGSFATLACEGNAGNLCQLGLGASASVKDVLEMNPTSGLLSLENIRGWEFTNISGGTIANAVVETVALNDSAFFNLVVDYFSGRGLWIHDGTGGSQLSNSVSFYNIYLNGNHIAGGQPLVIESLHGNSVGSLHFYGTDWGHPGSGQFSIALNGHASGVGVGVNHIDFHGIYLESNSTDTTTAIASIIDATDVNFDSVNFNRLAAGSTAPGLAISESAAAKTFHITAEGFRVVGGTNCTGTITNSVPGLPNGTQNGCSFNHYSFISSEDINSFAYIGGIKFTGSAQTISGNNVTQTVGSGTATSAGTIINAGTSQTLAVTVTGAATTDVASCATNAAFPATWQTGIQVLPPVVTSNTVTLTFSNPTAGNITPAAQTFRCTVTR